MPPGLICSVAKRSLGARAGLRTGDSLASVNGNSLRDVIDVRVYAGDDHLSLAYTRDGVAHIVEIERRYGESLGLEFAVPTFDPIRRCSNRCDFCFIDQMPKGLRRSLYVRDDDYRYSFLFGSFVSLNNLGEADWDRIAEQHLSPLYVSVHATDPDLRERMMGSAQARDVMARLRRLVGIGVEVHTQIVVVPGINDGAYLGRSIEDLAQLHAGVRSLSVVPIGVTRYHCGTCRVHTNDEMHATVNQVIQWQEKLRARLGVGFAYLSDEWFLKLGEPVPPASEYDGLDLAENGVGAVRQFLDGADARLRTVQDGMLPQTLVTGTLFAPVLRQVVADFPHVRVVSVINAFFGETVTVAGLLTGQDVVAQLTGNGLGEQIVLPPEMLGGPEGTTLDGVSVTEIERAVGCRVLIGESRRPGGLL